MLFQHPSMFLMELGRRTFALSYLPSLLRSQWKPHEILHREQMDTLRSFLTFCRDEIPYYGRVFADTGFRPEEIRSKSDLSSLPLLHKNTVREFGDDLKSIDFKTRVTKSKTTSGSTGVPLTFHLDGNAHSTLWANIWRAWAQLDYKPGDLYATLAGGALLPDNVSFVKKLYSALSRSINMPCYHLNTELLAKYARILESRPVKVLYGYPSSIELLADFVLNSSIHRPRVASVVTTSELLTPSARSSIEEAFAARVFDTYGCNDAGLYSFECENHAGYHVGMESVVVEVVDDDGNPLPQGQVGRIVATHTANKCFAFVRYVTGDLGALDYSPCPCGRGLERIVSLQGRESDYVMTPDGRKVLHPFFLFFGPFHDFDWIERWQIYQPSVLELVVRLKTRRSPTMDEERIIISEMQRGLGKMDIRIELVDEFETTRKGKFRMIVSDLDD